MGRDGVCRLRRVGAGGGVGQRGARGPGAGAWSPHRGAEGHSEHLDPRRGGWWVVVGSTCLGWTVVGFNCRRQKMEGGETVLVG